MVNPFVDRRVIASAAKGASWPRCTEFGATVIPARKLQLAPAGRPFCAERPVRGQPGFPLKSLQLAGGKNRFDAVSLLSDARSHNPKPEHLAFP
jgi:hypothetical protein